MKYEVGQTHHEQSNVDLCQNPECTREHLYSVYTRDEQGEAHWVSDHATHKTAQRAADAYADPHLLDDYDDLTQQLAASIMDCVSIQETKAANGIAHEPHQYAWGETRSEMYVDVARMARDTAAAWTRHDIAGIIYEVSEAIAEACIKEREPLEAEAIDVIIESLKGLAQ